MTSLTPAISFAHLLQDFFFKYLLAQRNASPRTISSYRDAFRLLLRYVQPLLGFLSREEMDAVQRAPDASTWSGRRDRALLAVLYNTGARVSEAIGLRATDVDTASATAAVHLRGKGRKEVTHPQTACSGRGAHEAMTWAEVIHAQGDCSKSDGRNEA